MKRLVKICTAVLVLGLVLAIGGRAAGGELYTSYWHGGLHTLRESLDMGNAFIPPRQARGWSEPPTRPGRGNTVAPNASADDRTQTAAGLDFELERGDYRIVSDDARAYTLEGSGSAGLKSWFDEDGVWHVERTRGHGKNALVTIYLPENVVFDEIDIEAAANSVELDTLRAREIDLSIGAAAFSAGTLNCDALSVEVGAGALEAGTIDAKMLTAEVGMGAFSGTLAGSAADYRYTAEAALGSVTLDGAAVAGGIAAQGSGGSGTRLLELKTGMGSIELNYAG